MKRKSDASSGKSIYKIDGEVVLNYPSIINIYVVALIILFVLFVTVILTGHYNKVIHANGYTTYSNGEIRVFSPSEGILIKKYVVIGDRVKVGEPLYEVKSNDCSSSVDKEIYFLKEQRSNLEEQYDKTVKSHQSKVSYLYEKISDDKKDIISLNNILKIKNHKVALQTEKNKAIDKLSKNKMIDVSSIVANKIKFDEYVEEVNNIEREIDKKKAS